MPALCVVGGEMRNRSIAWRAITSALALTLLAGAGQAAERGGPRRGAAVSAQAMVDDDGQARVIVKYRQGSALAADAAGTPRHAARLGKQMALLLQDGPVLGRRTQGLRARGIGAAALATRLAANPDVEWAEPVRRKTISAVVPNDPLFADNQATTTPAAGQWYLRAPDATLVSAVNALGAWAITEGAASLTVAVLDTGVRYDHPDLAGKLWPGYDFVSRTTTAADGGGRDADANDPGDWSTETDTCGASNSSWHGTQVAGLIGAATDNGIGMAGVGRNVMVLPVRVLGRCGGFDDDIIAGMRWAAGLANTAACGASSPTSATCNPHPARVLNLSLGSSGTCSNSYRDAMAELTAAGVVVVVASGNDAGRAVNEPANCPGALAVAGVRHAGTKVGYSNMGPQVAIAAPAGNCVNLAGPCLYPLIATLNAGTTTPGASVYSDSFDPSLGTSFATPMVAGAVGLMLSVNPALTSAQVKAMLQASARSFPVLGAQANGTTRCEAPGEFDQIECYCTTTTCGAGLLDVAAAVARVASRSPELRPVFQVSAQAPTAGMRLQLDSSPSTVGVVSRRWSLVTGDTFASFEGDTGSTLATLVTRLPGTVVVRLTTTDAAGSISFVDKTIQVKSGPTAVLSVSTGRSSVGAVLALSATGSAASPGRTITAFEWRLAGDTPARFTTATNGSTAGLATDSIGQDLTVEVTVTDSAGDRHVNDQTITVSAGPVAVATASTTAPASGTTFQVNGSDSAVSPGLRLAGYQWSVVSGNAFVQMIDGANTSVATLRAIAPGSAVLRLTVTDDAGASSTADLAVNVVTPSQTGGGGGAMSLCWLLGLAGAVLALWRGRP